MPFNTDRLVAVLEDPATDRDTFDETQRRLELLSEQ